jgi:hypothetical protein
MGGGPRGATGVCLRGACPRDPRGAAPSFMMFESPTPGGGALGRVGWVMGLWAKQLALPPPLMGARARFVVWEKGGAPGARRVAAPLPQGVA